MYVIKNNKSYERVSFDKILKRIDILCNNLKLDRVNTIEVTKDTINGLYDKISTEEIDHYAAINCAEKIREDPQYDKLAAGLCISRLHKITSDDFMYTTNQLYNNQDKFNKNNPLVSKEYYEFIQKNIECIQKKISESYHKDYYFDYFGYKTLERAYLKNNSKNNTIIERPQHMLMRVACGINMDSIDDALETYECLSNKYFIFGSPTLYNAGTDFCQCSSCFLLYMGDSLDEILDTIKEVGLISKRAGGIGIAISNIRASGSIIRGTNGISNGVIPMIQVLNWLGRYVNQGGRRKGAIACFCKDTEVFTANDGIKKIQDVKIGDLVVTHKNRLRPVIQIHKNHLENRKIYKLQVEKNKDIYVTGNHKFWSFCAKKYKYNKLLEWNSIEELKNLMNNKSKYCYVSIPSGSDIDDLKNYKIDVMDYKNIIMTHITKELKILDYNKVQTILQTINNQSINRIWNITEDLAKFFGMWLPYGYIRKNKTKVLGIEITVHKDNKEEIAFIYIVCKKIFGCNITKYTSKISNLTHIILNSQIIGLIFMELFGNENKLPKMIFSWPKKLINCFIAGLITINSHIINKCNATLRLSNKNLINEIYHLCRNNGINVSFESNDYTITIPLNIENTNFLKILSISETDRTDDYVYTLGVQEDHSYTVEGLIVQNCYLEPWHADIFEFCKLRSNTGKEEDRARDIFLALWIPDLFMKRVESNSYWSLMCPDECPGLTTSFGENFEKLYIQYEIDHKYKKQIRAKDLWFHILTHQVSTGMPYMLYKDNVNRQSNQQNIGVIQSSNLCSEIVQFSSSDEISVCNLSSICLPQYVDKNQNGIYEFNFQKLIYNSKIAIRCLNKVINYNYYPVNKAKISNLKHRPIGLGVQGLADLYCILQIPFDSNEARLLNRKIFETIYFASLQMSVELAKKYGPYESFSYNGGCPFSKGQLQYHLWGLSESDLLMNYDWIGLIEEIKKYGTFNSLLTTIMPTASTSQIMGFIEACLTGDTLISLYCGLSVRIDSLNENKKVFSWNNNHIELSESVKLINQNIKDTIDIIFEDGRKITCTPDHMFLIDSGEWIEGQNLEINKHKVIASIEYPLDISDNDELNYVLKTKTIEFNFNTDKDRYKILAFSRILGYILSNRCIYKNKKFHIINMKCKFDINSICDDIEIIEGIKPCINKNSIRINNKLFNSIISLDDLMINKQLYQNIKLPKFLLQTNCPKSIIREFLGGYFGSNGTAPKLSNDLISSVKLSKSVLPEHIESLKEFMNNINILLIKLGINNSIISPPIKKFNFIENLLCICLTIPNGFLEKIGFRYCIQKSLLLSAATTYWRYNNSEFYKISYYSPIEFFKNIGCLYWFNQYANIINNESLNIPNFTLKVIAINSAPKQQVWDITVKSHSFLANGIMVHNCEPITTNVYTRTTLAGEFTVINKYLIEHLMSLGLWTQDIKNELLYDRGSIQYIQEIPDEIKKIYKTAYEIKNKPIVQQSIERGPFIDQSQSLNLFCQVPDFEMLTSSHFYSWRNKLKTGLYYLRTQPAVNAISFGLDEETIIKIKKKRNNKIINEIYSDINVLPPCGDICSS